MGCASESEEAAIGGQPISPRPGVRTTVWPGAAGVATARATGKLSAVKDAYLEPYRRAQATHGASFDVTLWARPETQQRRFGVFAELVDFSEKRILDAGCSRGDFAAWLGERDINYAHFRGVDGVEAVIDFARGRALPRADFVAADFVREPGTLGADLAEAERPDVVVISGTLNTMDWPTARGVLEAAWAGCGNTLIFNFLSNRCGPEAPVQLKPAVRLPTDAVLDWAMSQTWNVVFRQDYFAHGHDATVRMARG